MGAPASTLITPRYRTIDGLSVRYAEGGEGDQDAILLSPWPESVYAFERTWNRLAGHARLVAVDPPGFGGSEYRAALMSPRAMGDFVLRVADTFGMENPHVVGPDIGTSSSLFAAAAQPGRFRSIVVGSGGAAVPLQLDGVLKDWVDTDDLEPYRRTDGRHIVAAAVGTIEGYTPPPGIEEDYLASYAGTRFADSMAYVRAYPEELPALADLLPGITTPVRVVAGAADQVVPRVNAEYLVERLPHGRADFIEGAGHFCWEERPDEYAALVTDWWERTRPEAS